MARIVKEIANAFTYLHMAFPNIIIYRDTPFHIFLDENWTAKLSDLASAVLIEEGKSQIESNRVLGSLGYMDPLYAMRGIVSEYTDVYSFGVFLLVLLTGRPAFAETNENSKGILEDVKELYKNGKLDEVTDEMMMKDLTSGQRLLLEACVALALRCCEMKHEDRPKMMEIAKQLKRIERSFTDPICSDGALHLERRTSNRVRVPNRKFTNSLFITSALLIFSCLVYAFVFPRFLFPSL